MASPFDPSHLTVVQKTINSFIDAFNFPLLGKCCKCVCFIIIIIIIILCEM